MVETDIRVAPPSRGGPEPLGAPPPEPQPLDTAPPEPVTEAPAERSLLEDLEALYQDGRTYASAELQFQKTRASFATDRIKSGVTFGAIGAVVALLAAIGLTVGLILTLATVIGPLLATLVVVAAMLVVAYIFVKKAMAKFNELSRAFSSRREPRT